MSAHPKKKKASAPKAKKTKASSKLVYSDIDLAQWRDYEHIETGSLWHFDTRDKERGHQLNYHGNCVPQILTQLLTRFTQKGDIVLDCFLGSGTSAIEAGYMGRRCLGLELKEEQVALVQNHLQHLGYTDVSQIHQADSSNRASFDKALKKGLKAFNAKEAQFAFLHPPYDDIIKFSELDNDLSNAENTEAFLDAFEKVAQNAYRWLKPGRFAALVIGDKYTNGELLPLGFWCMERMSKVGFQNKSIIVKNIAGNEKAKGRMSNLWRYRALKGGFYVFKHEYVMIFRKPLN